MEEQIKQLIEVWQTKLDYYQLRADEAEKRKKHIYLSHFTDKITMATLFIHDLQQLLNNIKN